MAAQAAPLVRRKPAARGAPLQAKLGVGPVNDRHEQEADRVAARVGSAAATTASPPPTISGLSAQRTALPAKAGPERKDEPLAPPEQRAQRKAEGHSRKEPEKRGVAQRKSSAPAVKDDHQKPRAQGERTTSPAVDAAGGEAPAAAEAAIARMRAAPAPGLDPATRDVIEGAVGSGLGDVRVHADSAAAGAASELGARAFTVGSDMFFGAGEYRPQTTEGKRLIAHEAAHTVQQRGGSPAARKVQRVKKKKAAKGSAPKVPTLGGKGWSINRAKADGAPKGTLMVPKLELPEVEGKLKGEKNPKIGFAQKTELPEAGKTFTRYAQESRDQREDGPAYQKWVENMHSSASKGLEKALKKQLKDQGDAAPITNPDGKSVYVLKRAGLKTDNLDMMIVGTPEELSLHDSMVRPMLNRAKGGPAKYDADHILEDQLGGPDTAANMWLLERGYNRSIGAQIKARINKSIETTLDKARAEEEKQGVELDGGVPDDVQFVKVNMAVVFEEVVKGRFEGSATTYWTRQDIIDGTHMCFYKALTETELGKQGFIRSADAKPTRINVFPAKDGGRPVAFPVSSNGKKVTSPDTFFRGMTIEGAPTYTPLGDEPGQVILEIPVIYGERIGKGKGKKKDQIVTAFGMIKVRHDPLLGFGGYVTRDSLSGMLAAPEFEPLSPIKFPDPSISSEGDLLASGQILSSKALLPGLQIPISLRGNDIFVSFPIPSKELKFGPVTVSDAALLLGVGDKGFFIEGSAQLMVQDIGQGTLFARVEKDDVLIGGDFELDLDFLKPASLKMVYSIAKDDFDATGSFTVRKDALPGVESGKVDISVTRQSFGLVGTLQLGGLFKGSTITAGYTPENGLLIEGKDLPLPVSKVPGVSDAKATVRARRNPDTGEWAVSGGGKATLSGGGASGTLDVLVDGLAVDFSGRVDVAKGPASGWLQISASNRAVDDEGKPVEGGKLGELAIWGKGEAKVAFGKVLTGTAGIEYTREGHVIVVGEIAMPPTYDLFPKKDLSPDKPLFKFKTPDFPIWGVKVGPVGVGVFAFADASLVATAWVGPGQLRNALVAGTIDLDKPEEAKVEGKAQFYVPAYAGLTLDIGGGLKAQAAVAYVKGRVGIYASLGLLIEGMFDIGVTWSQAQGLAIEATPAILASPKFEVGVTASVAVGVDLGLFDIEKEWGPWKEKLGEFGPDMQFGAKFPMAWSEVEGLDIDPGKIEIQQPNIDAPALMKDTFLALV